MKKNFNDFLKFIIIYQIEGKRTTQHSEKTTFNQQSNFTSNWFAISIIYSLYYKQNIHSSHETKWEEYTTTKKDKCNFCLILIFKRS